MTLLHLDEQRTKQKINRSCHHWLNLYCITMHAMSAIIHGELCLTYESNANYKLTRIFVRQNSYACFVLY